MKKLIIAISSVFMLFATSASSMDFNPTIGISGSKGVYAATGIENNFNEAGSAIDETTKEYGAFEDDFSSIFLELGIADGISIGLDYVVDAIVTPTNTSNEDNSNENNVSAEFKDLTTIYAKIDVPLGGTYLKIGYSEVDVVSKEVMSSGNSYGDASSSGMTAGLGYNHEVSDGFSVRAELTLSEFDNVSTNNGQTNKTEIKVEDMIGARATISIAKSF